MTSERIQQSAAKPHSNLISLFLSIKGERGRSPVSGIHEGRLISEKRLQSQSGYGGNSGLSNLLKNVLTVQISRINNSRIWPTKMLSCGRVTQGEIDYMIASLAETTRWWLRCFAWSSSHLVISSITTSHHWVHMHWAWSMGCGNVGWNLVMRYGLSSSVLRTDSWIRGTRRAISLVSGSQLASPSPLTLSKDARKGI